MPNPLSMDLRQRIVRAYTEGEGTFREIARRFEVGTSTVTRLVAYHRAGEGLEPRPHSGGRVKKKLFEEHLQAIISWLTEKPDLTLIAVTERLKEQYDIDIHDSQISRHLSKMGWTRKKKSGR